MLPGQKDNLQQVSALPVLAPVTESHPEGYTPMNPTAATNEETTRSIERYLTANAGNEPLNTLGITADGRIVRLAEEDESQQPELRRLLEHQLGTLLPREIDGTVRKRIIENSLSTDFQNYQDRIRWDRQIRNRLSYLKEKYAAKFAVMNERTNTTFAPNGLTKTDGIGLLENGNLWRYEFNNFFTRTQWEFEKNFKSGKADVKDFYMSNVIAHQFEQTFQHNCSEIFIRDPSFLSVYVHVSPDKAVYST
ncbi:hypothetical protein [Endozoicomonas sp. YOMI1]|uniref:hypothetical protein n=1 Tax=Endozoicomonas sp. YOMI1 TaxID=2828739 RepID=UPI002148CE61|nr:hypothetical protein [Endozoicomonas sp. YOMI1]